VPACLSGVNASDPFSTCSYISYFISIEIPVGNNVTKKFIVYSALVNDVNSSLTILDENFTFVAMPFGVRRSFDERPRSVNMFNCLVTQADADSAFPGILTTLEYAFMKDDPETVMIAYGGISYQQPRAMLL
jgi:hypothetical protein